jgi:hypothetical protein
LLANASVALDADLRERVTDAAAVDLAVELRQTQAHGRAVDERLAGVLADRCPNDGGNGVFAVEASQNGPRSLRRLAARSERLAQFLADQDLTAESASALLSPSDWQGLGTQAFFALQKARLKTPEQVVGDLIAKRLLTQVINGQTPVSAQSAAA